MARSLQELRESVDASTLSVPLHRHLGIDLEREPSGAPHATMAGKPELLAPGGIHSPAAVYVLADVAAAVSLVDEIAPAALETGQAAMFLTVAAEFRPVGPAAGKLLTSAQVTEGLRRAQDGRPPKKATVGVSAHVSSEGGEPAAEHHASFYVRFMEPDSLRAMMPESSQLVQILET
jgi:acyl-coenzyme A thioesterase PaaI-like protein